MKKLILIGIGGSSCSGKSTCVEWLSKLLPGKIIHQDKYFKSDSEIPTKKLYSSEDSKKEFKEVSNWDCPEALDMEAFHQYLVDAKLHQGIKDNILGDNLAHVHDSHLTKEERECIEKKIQDLRTKLNLVPNISNSNISTTDSHYGNNKICTTEENAVEFVFVDGFLLYCLPSLIELLDVRIFMHAPYETVKQRRSARMGYVTIEGYWQDPPGYFDQIVYPEYLKNNQFCIECINDPTKADDRKLVCIDSSKHSIGQCLLEIMDSINKHVS